MNRLQNQERQATREAEAKVKRLNAKLAQMEATLFLREQAIAGQADQLRTTQIEREALRAENEMLKNRPAGGGRNETI